MKLLERRSDAVRWKGSGEELAALGVNVTLGTDHASSGTCDLVQEMRTCACSYKELRLNPRIMPPEQPVETFALKPDGKTLAVVVDAGMTDLLRPSHYNAYHRIEAVEPAEAAGCRRVSLLAYFGILGAGYALALQRTGRLEMAILAHFAVNAVHFLLFTYPALA